jgi:hypothetical protein
MTVKTAGTAQGPAFPKASAIFPTQKNEAVAHYVLERLTNKVLAREYRTMSRQRNYWPGKLKRRGKSSGKCRTD